MPPRHAPHSVRRHALMRAVPPLVFVLVLASACDAESGGASSNDPPPTIGLGSNLDGTVGGIDGRAEDAGAIDTIVMIGDSITHGATAELGARFDALGFDDVTIDAIPGKRIAFDIDGNPAGSSVAQFVAASEPDDRSNELWIVALGTNDVGQYGSPEEVAAAVNETIDAVPAESSLLWVDVYFRDRAEQAADLNAIVRERLERRGNSAIAPWTAFAEAEGVLVADGVHTTDAGKDTFAFVVTDSARAFLGR